MGIAQTHLLSREFLLWRARVFPYASYAFSLRVQTNSLQ
jgi:hypothetical protein